MAELIREADATAHSVAINPVDELKPRATAEGPASAEEDRRREVVAGAAVVVEAAVAAAARWSRRRRRTTTLVGDSGRSRGSFAIGSVLKEPRTNRD